jgi:hypothetical protein
MIFWTGGGDVIPGGDGASWNWVDTGAEVSV